MTTATPRPLRVILLTQWFDPEPQIKGLLFARRLKEAGFETEVVTGFPNYPGGSLYPGYRIRALQRERIDGVDVTRVPLYPSHDRSKLRRGLNYISFMSSAWFYLTFMARKADVLYVYHPPITVGLAAVLSQLVRRTPVVLDIQDMWPDTLRSTGMVNSDRLIGVIGSVCRFVYARCSHIIAQSNGFRSLLLSRGVQESNVTVIYNWADEEVIGQSVAERPAAMPADGTFRVLFAGNMGPAQALDTVLDAAKIVAQSNPDIEFCFLGNGVETDRLAARARSEGIRSARFLPRVLMEEVGPYLAAADCLLVHLRADPLFAITVPSKTQAYMAAGRPLLMAVEGDAAELVRESGGGLAVPPENSAALAGAVLQMAGMSADDRKRMGERAADYYGRELSLRHGVEAFAELFRTLVQRGRR